VSGSTIDWYNAATGGATVTNGYGTASFAPTITSSTTYYAQSRNTTTFCVSATRLAVARTVVANPSTPSLTQNGPKCAGTAVTFTASGGSGSYDWSGQFSGSGNTKPSPTTAGNYSAQVRSVTTASGVTCYSGYTSSVTGTVNAPAGYGYGIKVGSCGCATGLVLCGTACAPKCTYTSVVRGCDPWPFTHKYANSEDAPEVTSWSKVLDLCAGAASVNSPAPPPGNLCADFRPNYDAGYQRFAYRCCWWPY
jgi:hypothetical protein